MNRTQYMREYKRAQRVRARTCGKCIICLARECSTGNVTCRQCQTRNNTYHKKGS